MRRWGSALLVAWAVARAGASRAAPGEDAVVVAVDGDVRLRRGDGAEALRVGQRLPPAGGVVARAALPGETIALQIVAVAGAGRGPIPTIALEVPELVGPGGALLRADLFREHTLRVDRRSRNDRRAAESLGWHPGARPPDDRMLGDVPDALVPAAVAIDPVAPPPAIPAGGLGAFWVDVNVPEGAPPGRYAAAATLAAGGAATRFALAIDVRPTPLPFRAASVFIYYEADRLTARMGLAGDTIERQLWQLLHAHHIDALAPLALPAHVERLAQAYDGTLFTAAAGYRGPGIGRPPAVVALGAYGLLGAPSPDALARVDGLVARLPAGPELFLYAIDESCASSRAGDWRRALAAHPPSRPVAVAQTCDDPPAEQPVDIAMVSAFGFERGMTAAARASGRRAFIYNGVLPRTGTLMLDADPKGLVANGWIAAAAGIERWFYWESIFWDDGNRGGRGPIDPFVTAESFHNADGDSALGDGLLLYPGRQEGRFAASSLGTDAVFPSIRLKAIRRGIQDAGLIALAARERPEEAARIVARALPAALDEADPAGRASWEAATLSFEAARAALRDLATQAAPMSPVEVRAALDDLAERRRRAVPLAPAARPRGRLLPVALVAAAAAVITLGFAARAGYSRRRKRKAS